MAGSIPQTVTGVLKMMKQIHKYLLGHTASLTTRYKIIAGITTHIGYKHIPIFYIIDGNFFQRISSFDDDGCPQLRELNHI